MLIEQKTIEELNERYKNDDKIMTFIQQKRNLLQQKSSKFTKSRKGYDSNL